MSHVLTRNVKAFVLGMKQTDTKNMMSQVKAMIFFSAPHRGASMQLLSLFWSSVPHDYIQELRKDSPFLTELNNEFAPMSQEHGLELFSFYETLPTDIAGKKHMVRFRNLIEVS